MVDIPGMSVRITLANTSQVVIIFSAEAWMSSPGDYMSVQALVDSSVAHPSATGNLLVLTRATFDSMSSYSYTFYLNNVSAGVHTVKMQWQSYSGATANMESRTLTVFAIPA
jgi:bacillopeptidase F (M6 metalloprotease family)